MNPNNPRHGDICIAIDPMGVSQFSIAIAVLLAEKLNTGLYGLLLGNDLLHTVAQLPFTTEILVATGDERELASEKLHRQYQRSLEHIKQLVERSAAPRQVRCQLEISEGHMSLDLILEHQPVLFLPSPEKRRPGHDARGRKSSVKWVYDGSEASQHCFDLLKALIGEKIVDRVFLVGKSAVPEGILSEFSALGARVFWMNLVGDDVGNLLRSTPEVELIVIPRPLCALMGEKELVAINRATSASVIVVS